MSLPGLKICRKCFETARRNIASAPSLYDACRHALLPAPRAALPERIRGGRDNDLPLRESALEARLQLQSVLASWADLVVDERSLLARPERTIQNLAHFIGNHLIWLAGHFAGADFADELDEAVLAGQRAVDFVAANVKRNTRQCPVAECTGTLSVQLDGNDSAGRPEILCTAGHRLSVDESVVLEQRGRTADRPARPPRTVTTQVAALTIGVSEDTIRQWVRRGKITRYGTPQRAEFDVAELLQVAQGRRKRGPNQDRETGAA